MRTSAISAMMERELDILSVGRYPSLKSGIPSDEIILHYMYMISVHGLGTLASGIGKPSSSSVTLMRVS